MHQQEEEKGVLQLILWILQQEQIMWILQLTLQQALQGVQEV